MQIMFLNRKSVHNRESPGICMRHEGSVSCISWWCIAMHPGCIRLSINQGSKLTLAPSPEASGNRGGWVEFLHRSSAGRVDISIYFVSYKCLRMNQTTEISLEWQLKALPITKITFVDLITVCKLYIGGYQTNGRCSLASASQTEQLPSM